MEREKALILITTLLQDELLKQGLIDKNLNFTKKFKEIKNAKIKRVLKKSFRGLKKEMRIAISENNKSEILNSSKELDQVIRKIFDDNLEDGYILLIVISKVCYELTKDDNSNGVIAEPYYKELGSILQELSYELRYQGTKAIQNSLRLGYLISEYLTSGKILPYSIKYSKLIKRNRYEAS